MHFLLKYALGSVRVGSVWWLIINSKGLDSPLDCPMCERWFSHRRFVPGFPADLVICVMLGFSWNVSNILKQVLRNAATHRRTHTHAQTQRQGAVFVTVPSRSMQTWSLWVFFPHEHRCITCVNKEAHQFPAWKRPYATHTNALWEGVFLFFFFFKKTLQ